MYVPDAFRLEEREALLGYVTAYPFATVVTQGEGGLGVSHLPLLVGARGDVLRGHLARENQQLGHLAAGAEALAIFHGPHGYVSPSVYAVQPSVPTWNYVAVHAYGPVEFYTDPDRLLALVTRLTRRHEDKRAQPWAVSAAPDDFIRSQLKGIVGCVLRINRLEGKWKMSQNRVAADRAGVTLGLRADGNTEVAALVEGAMHPAR